MDLSSAQDVLDLARTVEDNALDPAAAEWTNRLLARVDDIPAAAESFLVAGKGSAALDLVGALSLFWQDTGRVQQGRSLTESVIDRAGDDVEARPQARAALVLGELAFRQGDQQDRKSTRL